MTNITREHVHTRSITLEGYSRSDGLMDIEGEIKDTKTYDFPNSDRGVIHAHEPLHHMKVKITIDDDLNIVDAEAETLSSPYPNFCPSATIGFKNLIGLKIASGWRRKVRQAIGGITGCTHITELMGPVATVAFQTLYGELARRKRQDGASVAESHDTDALVDSCIGHAEDYEEALRLAHDSVNQGGGNTINE